MHKLQIFLFLLLSSSQIYAASGCYHAIVAQNGSKNIMDLCIQSEDMAAIRMIYLNDIEKKEAPATCLAMAQYKESNNGNSFTLKSSLGECNNNIIMGKFNFSCDLIEKDLYGCNEQNLKFRFFFSKEL